MSEPESLDTDEALPRRVERHWYDRLIMLSDGVFAIAMTLLALEVRPPDAWDGSLADLLEKTWRSLFGYGLSFFIVAVFWYSNRSILALIRRVDGRFTALTLVFLCLIGLTPFATALMAQYGPGRTVQSYAILVGAIGTAQAMLWSYAAFWAPLLDPAVATRERWLTLAAFLMMPALAAVAGLFIRPGASGLVLLFVGAAAIVVGRLRRKLMRSGLSVR